MTGQQEKIMCGCFCCNGNCMKVVNRHRSDEINWQSNEEKRISARSNLKKAYKANIQVIDSIIILKRLKRILYDNEN